MIPRHLQIAAALLLLALIAGGVYMYQLKRRDERNLSRALDPSALVAPVAGQPAKVQLTIAFDDDGVLVKREHELLLPLEPAARAREVLRALVREYVQNPSPHVLGASSEIRAAYLLDDGLCVVDLNAAFSDQHRSGILIEQFTLVSLIDTLASNVPQVKRVKFLVDGGERETLAGHADLSVVYDVAAVRGIAAELGRR
jgi:hypothetical protein